MKSYAEVAALVRSRSPLPSEETERLIRTSFVLARNVRFVCRHYRADRLRVLDIGCGYGQHLVHFGPGSVGVDAVQRNVDFVRALGCEALLANVEDGLPNFERPFEAAFASNLLEHLVSPHLFLLRLHKLLVPDGLIFLHVPTIPPLPLLDRLVKLVIGHNGYRASEHIYAFTPHESVWRRMTLLWGVRAFKVSLHEDDPEATLLEAIETLKKGSLVQSGDMLVFISQVRAHGDSHDSIQPRRVP